MDKYKQRVLNAKIGNAREACAGGNVQEKPFLICLLVDAYAYAINNDADLDTQNIIRNALVKANDIEQYKDRLPIDNTLCDLLNTMET